MMIVLTIMQDMRSRRKMKKHSRVSTEKSRKLRRKKYLHRSITFIFSLNMNPLPMETKTAYRQMKKLKNIKEKRLEDSDLAGSQFGESPNQIHEVDGGDTTTEARIPEPKMKSNNNFISTKETKTMTTKRKNDGDTETEISSRVKIIMQPNNSTRTRKYVKVYPKILMGNSENKNTLKQKIGEEEVASVEQISFEQKPNKTLRGIYIEEIITTTPTEVPVTTVSPPEFTELFTEEIPTTTSPTTAIPSIKETSTRKDIPETLESIEKAFWSIGSRSRRKRFTNDFPDEKVDTDFISKINHDLGKPSEDLMHVKYPYYNDNEKYGINENSPLRYSEDLKNIPLKKEGDMTFYEQAESLAGCPEIDSTIDPIPDRIRNAEVKGDDSEEYEDEDEEDTEVVENPKSENEKSVSLPDQPKSPRLTGLGDRIDCLKAIYFGKNPLDSPIFAEETVGGVKPIFEDFQKRKLIEIDSNTTNGTMVGDMPSTNEIMSSPDRKHEHDLSSPQPNNNTDYFYPEQNKPLNPYTSTTTSDTPTTLDVEKMVLSVFNDINQHMKTEISNGDDKTPQTTVQTVSSINILTTPQYTIDLKPKHIYDQIQLLSHLPGKNDSTNNQSNAVKLVPNVGIKEVPKETIQTNQTSRQGKEHGNENIQTPESSVNMPTFLDDGNSLPDAEALRRRKKIRIMRKPPRFHIAAPRRIPSTTTQPIFTKHMTASTVLPKYKVVSEVFYKDDIKPNEQLQVLTDIMNNIMNSSQKSESEASDEFSEPVSVTLSKNRIDLLKNSKNHHGDSYLKAYSDQEVDDSYYASTITSTTRPNVHEAVPSYNFESIENGLEKYHPTDKFRLYSALLEAKKKHNLEKMISTTPEYEKTVSSHQHVPHHQVTRVMGLMPPGTNQFKTIYHPKRDNKHHFTNPGSIEKKIINNFLVMGMKPPPKQRFFLYADFANNNHLRNRKNPLRRGKRSTNRMSYAQLSRNREQQEESVKDDSDDDYVPHRPMNFYYDEKTGKIIYNKDKNADAEKDDEDLEYIEVVEDLPETTQKPKPKQNPIFATATPPPEGQSYIDFVNRLKNSSEYQLIPDPTTTEKGAEAITEKVISSTEIAKSTSPPEFLSILQKVRDDSEYKFIEDKKDKKDNKVMSTTTVTPEEFAEEEEDEEEETAPTNVKNSPGGVQHDYPKEGFQIFDISDYIPKLKNYLPKTSIDTSRYKTIQRPTHAPILEVESDSEEEKVPETTNTNRKITEDKNMEVAADTLREETITNEREEESSYQPLGSTTDTIIPMGHSPTTSPIEKIRRRRPTTRRSVVTTKRHTPVTVSSLDTIEHQKARRNYRRRPLRIKVTSTTEKFPDEEVDDTTRVLRRRSNAYNPELTGNLDGTTGTPTTSRKLTNPRKIGPRRYVEIVKKYNHNKRLEGNLSGDDKNRYPLQHVRGTHRRSKDIEVISEYDPSEKHGGNYKRENEDVVKDNNNETLPKQELNEPVLGASRKGENVEVIGDFDKEKKHGGNYNYENEADVDKPEAIYTKTKNENEDDVDKLEAIYTKTNEMQEPNEELSRVDLLPISSSEDEKSDLEDAEVKTSISKGISAKPSSRSNKPKKTIVKQKKRFRERTKPVQRLTDVVTKPETFYTDTTLPRSINLLVTDTLSSEELGAFSEETSSGEIEKDVEITSGQASNTNSTSEKKPSFIEDPSKRLYYYAPI
ncbi:hypothetical protein JTB14_024827 [Gonioctena quinquepunctata]|nr:hypothetical protein JTB14_024827 [Gonioctena quinquepunctata]